MSPEKTREMPFVLDDFTDFVAAQRAVSRDAAQAVLGEWLLKYSPHVRALHMASTQRQPPMPERATNTPAG